MLFLKGYLVNTLKYLSGHDIMPKGIVYYFSFFVFYKFSILILVGEHVAEWHFLHFSVKKIPEFIIVKYNYVLGPTKGSEMNDLKQYLNKF